jgi:uncharacterized protein
MMIGRAKEIQTLQESFASDRAEMIAVYGRRRIGKTYLIQEFYRSKPNTFFVCLTGQSGDDMKAQIRNSARVLKEKCDITIKSTAKWDEVFDELKKYHQAHHRDYEHFTLFIDETPWIATAKSGFIGALGHSWNIYFSAFSNVTFVLCGSAASWMLKNIASDKGELHGRITRRIALKPFTLRDCKLYLESRGFILQNKHIIDYYMTLGGVAEYLKHLNPNKSYSQNIDELCFKSDGILYDEFSRLFVALFGKTPHHRAVVEFLGSKKTLRYSATDIAKSLKIDAIATVYGVLDDLEAAGFIKAARFYNQDKRDTLYSLSDPYSYFYLKWIKGLGRSVLEQNDSYWAGVEQTQLFDIWAGNAFEMVAHNHIPQIKYALGISGVQTDTCYWKSKGDETSKGAQIDLLIKRADRTVSIVECKYWGSIYEVDSAYEQNLNNKKTAFGASDKEKNALTLAMLTTYGAKRKNGVNIAFSDITIDALFAV